MNIPVPDDGEIEAEQDFVWSMSDHDFWSMWGDGSIRIEEDVYDETVALWSPAMSSFQPFDASHVLEYPVVPQYHLLQASVQACRCCECAEGNFVAVNSQQQLVGRWSYLATQWDDGPAELLIPSSCVYMLCGLDPNLVTSEEEDYYLVCRFYNSGQREIVKQIDRDIARTLTSEEIKQNAEALRAAKLSELKKWVDLFAFHRIPRKEAVNPVDSRWVLTWKIIDGVRSIKA